MNTVMLVEDEIIVRKWLRQAIRWDALSLRVSCEAGNGQEALALYAAERPDVVITDLRMPVMDGIELIRRIRRTDADTRIIILTCLEEFDLLKQAMELGISAYIQKVSADPRDIERELAKAMGETAPRDAEQAAAVPGKVALALREIEERYAEDLSVQAVADRLGLTPNYLGRVFLQCVGESFGDRLTRVRMEEAKRLLRDPARRVYEIARAVGFYNDTYFYRLFKQHTGLTPSDYREREAFHA